MSHLKPNPWIDAMGHYARADLSLPDGVEPVMLAQNESALPPSPKVFAAIEGVMAKASLYPDPDWQGLRTAIASVHGIDPGAILCGCGSMELIASIARAYLGPDDRALVTQYGYLFFKSATAMTGASIDVAAEQNYTVDIDALIQAASNQTKLVFLANPGNPTGTRIANAEIKRLRQALPQETLLVVDEAYGEFADHLEAPDFDLATHSNTVILRTMSKAYALAGARVGWGVFPDEVKGQVRKVLNPNNLALITQLMATAAMQDQPHMRANVEDAIRIRDLFVNNLDHLGLSMPQSHTNFVLIDFNTPDQANSVEHHLRNRGLLVRNMGAYGLGHCLRISIGTEEQMWRTAKTIIDAMPESRVR